MPGRHITDHQMRLYMLFRQKNGLQMAAAKAGFSTATAYRIEADPRLPSTSKKRRGRRRPDPLGGIFDEEIVPMLEQSPGLRAVVLFAELMRRHPELDPGRLDPSSRTLRSRHPETRPPSRSRLDQPARDIHNRRNCSVNRNRQCLKVVDRFRGRSAGFVGAGEYRRSERCVRRRFGGLRVLPGCCATRASRPGVRDYQDAGSPMCRVRRNCESRSTSACGIAANA